MKFKGDNIFLSGANGGLASGLIKDFKNTDEVNIIIDVYFVAFYGNGNSNIPRDGKYIVAI